MPFLVAFEEVRPFSRSYIGKAFPIWRASLYSCALTTICVDEVPPPRSRPTTVRRGNGRGAINTY